MNTNVATASEPSMDTDFTQSAPRTDGPAWKAAEAEGHDMTIVASLLKMSLEERFKTHAAALATVNMLRGAKLVHG
ncbi:MAG: hypothetical protein WCK55_12840 [Verrucomicrobiota bacterium]